jgi:hypothetical protein
VCVLFPPVALVQYHFHALMHLHAFIKGGPERRVTYSALFARGCTILLLLCSRVWLLRLLPPLAAAQLG